MIYYVAGILLTGLLPVLPSVALSLFLAAAAVPFWLSIKAPSSLKMLLAGVLVALAWGHWQLAHRADSLNNRTVYELMGVIDQLPQFQPGRVRFNLRLEPAEHADPALKRLRTVRLSWYSPTLTLQPGMQLSVKAKLSNPRGLSNPAGFDYPRWLLSRGIDATGYVRELNLLSENQCCLVARYRMHMHQWLQTHFGNPEVSATLAALLLGIKDGLSEPQWQLLRKTGTVHLVVISGLHIGFAALLGGWLGLRLSFLLRRNSQDHRGWIVTGAISLALLYMLLAGAALPTQRAVLMLSVFLLAYLWLQSVTHWQRWWLALAAVLTFSPLSFYEAGLWLSFSAVAILLWFSGIRKQRGVVWRTQLAIMVGMLPLLIGWFGGSSLYAPVINLIAIPFTGFLVVVTSASTLLAGIFGFEWLLPLTGWLVEAFWFVLAKCAAFPGGYLQLPNVPFWALIMAAAGSLILMLPAGFPGRLLAPLFWLPMLAGSVDLKSRDEFEAWLFDVGQGLSLYVRSGNRHLIYDTGPGYRSGSDAFERAVLPALRQWQVDNLDLLILSHADNDHAGGRKTVLSEMNVDKVLTGSRHLVQEEGHAACYAGQRWQWQGTEFQMLAGSQGETENARSCVLEVRYGRCSLLATGDIGFEEEARIKPGPVHWLVASHHGSRYGTGETLLKRTKPEKLLVSASANNPFNHPHPEVLARASMHGSEVLETSSAGALRLSVDQQGRCRTESWRQMSRHYWQVLDL